MEIVMKKVKDIQPDTDQPRKEFDEEELKAFAEGIKAQGIMHPIEIDENSIIIDGERRWRAAQIAGLKEVPTILKEVQKEVNKDKLFRLKRQLQANLTGRNLKIAEARVQIEKLLAANNITQKNLGRQLGISQGRISQILAISKGSKELIEAVESKQIEDTTVASQIAALPEEHQKVLVKKITKEELGREDAQRLIKDVKDTPEEEVESKIEELDAVYDAGMESAEGLKEGYKKAKEMYPDDPDKQAEFSNKEKIYFLGLQLKKGNLFCPEHHKSKLVWACCGKPIGEKH